MSLKKVINLGLHLQNNLLSNFTKHSYKEFYRECLPFSHIRTGSRIPLMNCSPMFTRVSIDTKNVQLAVSKRTFEWSFLKLPHFLFQILLGLFHRVDPMHLSTCCSRNVITVFHSLLSFIVVTLFVRLLKQRKLLLFRDACEVNVSVVCPWFVGCFDVNLMYF